MQITIENYRAQPKKRPRLGKGHVYSPSAIAENALAWMILAKAGCGVKFRGPVSVTLDVYRKKRRADIDNVLKFVLDALQKSGIIENDRQVEKCTVQFLPGDDKIVLDVEGIQTI